MLMMKVRVGDVVQVGDVAAFRIAEKAGQWVGLSFNAPKSLTIKRLSERPAAVGGFQELEKREIEPVRDIFQFGPPKAFAPGIRLPTRSR